MIYEVAFNRKLDFEEEGGIWGGENEHLVKASNLVKYIHKGKGFCYNYALKDYAGGRLFIEDGYYRVVNNYRQIPIEQVRIGDLITTHNIADFNLEQPIEKNCQHFARIRATDGTLRGTVIRSKWGGWGIYEGSLTNLPTMYGNAVVFWRNNNK